MQQLIKHVFEQECKDLAIDTKLAQNLIKYNLYFINKNEDHVKFFGGHLTGVQIVRFTNQDRNILFEDILGVDEQTLTDKLLALPTVHANHVVASDSFNISCAWLVHAIFNAPKIPDVMKRQAIISVLLILQYKFLTSRLFRHFRFPAVEAVAEATYAALSMKFALKQYGSWGKMLNARAETIIDPEKGLHYQTLTKTFDDPGVERFLNDVQTRIRDMLKNIVNVAYTIHARGVKISTTSAVLEHDGKEILRDRTKSLAAYTRYLGSIVSNRGDFIREELLVVVEKLIHTMPPKLFRGTLDWMSDHYHDAKHQEIEAVLKETLIHSFDYLAENRAAAQNSTDLAGLLVRLKGVYTSARSTDPVLFALREKMENVVKEATGTKNVTLLAPVRTGVLLYVTLRAMCMRHYVNSV